MYILGSESPDSEREVISHYDLVAALPWLFPPLEELAGLSLVGSIEGQLLYKLYKFITWKYFLVAGLIPLLGGLWRLFLGKGYLLYSFLHV